MSKGYIIEIINLIVSEFINSPTVESHKLAIGVKTTESGNLSDMTPEEFISYAPDVLRTVTVDLNIV